MIIDNYNSARDILRLEPGRYLEGMFLMFIVEQDRDQENRVELDLDGSPRLHYAHHGKRSLATVAAIRALLPGILHGLPVVEVQVGALQTAAAAGLGVRARRTARVARCRTTANAAAAAIGSASKGASWKIQSDPAQRLTEGGGLVVRKARIASEEDFDVRKVPCVVSVAARDVTARIRRSDGADRQVEAGEDAEDSGRQRG